MEVRTEHSKKAGSTAWCPYWNLDDLYLLQRKILSGKPIDSYWFEMSCLSCLVFICVHCFFLKMMKLYKDICSAWISHTSADFFSIYWNQKHLKNTIDPLLFYGDYFSLFQEEINACAVHTHYVMDLCDLVGSIILLPPIMGMSFLLVVLTRLIVREPKRWVTWSHRTSVNFPFLREKRIQCFRVFA